jgi:hypothetical protein
MARLPDREWFKEPHGADCPEKLFSNARHPRPCRVTFIDTDFNGYLECRMRLVLDSQQPRIILSACMYDSENKNITTYLLRIHSTVANDMTAIQNGGHLVFSAQDNNFHMGIENPGNAAAEEIRQLRSPGKHPGWFQGMGRVSFIRIQPRKPAAQIGAPWMLEGNKLNTWTQLQRYTTTATQIYVWSKWETSSGYAVVENVHSWMRVLQFMVNSNRAKDSGEPRAFWAYRSEAKPGDNYSRRPELPWLRFTTSMSKNAGSLKLHAPNGRDNVVP